MNVARALTLSLLLFPLVGARAQSAAAALQKLETARSNLTKAVASIEKDPPSAADLDAALAAVNALKDAIDAGADHEQSDLDFAKAALAARKELRTQREYVELRRANVDVHNQRRVIDAAIAKLDDGARRTEAKDAVTKDFDEARAAADALKKAVEAARPLTKKDPKFATFITATDAALAKQSKAIDDRWTLLAVDKHRGLVAEARKGLTAAMAPLANTSTDAQFKEADVAASALSKLLDEGKVFESREKTYRAEAEAGRKEWTQAKKKMDALWSETGLARLKGEIEPAHKDLLAAGKPLRSRKPTPDQLAEARTAAIVVRKLVEKFQAEAGRSEALGKYVDTVKQTLGDVEGDLERRSLDAARADVAAALKNVVGKAPTDEHFDEATAAVGILEKTLETVHAKEPLMVQPVADAKAVVKEAKATLAARRIEVDVQRQKAKTEEARNKAAELMKQIALPDTGSARMSEAEAAIKGIGAALDEGTELTKKDKEYNAYDREVRVRMVELEGKLAARRIVLTAKDAKGLLIELGTDAKTKLDAAKLPEATDEDLAAATKALEALGKAVEARVALEKQDFGYYAQANKARDTFMRFSEGLEFAKQARELRRHTVETLVAASAAADGATTKPLRAQKDQYEKSITQFKSCDFTGSSMLRDNVALEKVPLFVDGKKTPAKDVVALCIAKLQATEKLLTEVKPLIAFDEGPKKSFETGKTLLAQKKDADALKHYGDCISSGMILQQRNPELKERKFTVAGGEMSLPELIQQCIGQQKALKGQK